MPELVMWRTGELSSDRRYLADLWGFVLTRQAHGTIQRTQVRPSLPARLHFWHYFRVLPQNVLSDCNGNLVLLSYSCSCVWVQLVQPCSFPGCSWAASSLAGATGSVQLGCCRPGLKLKGVEGATPPWGLQAHLCGPLWHCLEDTQAAWRDWASSS